MSFFKKTFTCFAMMTVLFGFILCTQKVQAKDSEGDMVIIIDPGHGGKDGGAVSVVGDKESDINFSIALAMKAELETYSGVKVYLTRGSAEWFSNTGRGRMGEIVGADLFVSIHNNADQSGSAQGVQVYGTVSPAYSDSMKALGNQILANVSGTGLQNSGYHSRASEKYPGRDYYTMLDESTKCGIPSLIIEHCYLSNSSDASFIHDKTNRAKVGVADATAVASYYGLSKSTVSKGESKTLVRTYSTMIKEGKTDSFKSSNADVAYVRNDGLVTAVGEGTAVISYTDEAGNACQVTISVPGVTLRGICAGINPTFMNASDVLSFNKSKVMVKAIYSDGHVTQVSDGVTVSDAVNTEAEIYDAAVSYKGLNCSLRIYGSGAAGSYGLDDNVVVGTNTDILVLPGNYDIHSTGEPTGGDVIDPIVTPTNPPTIAETIKAETTEPVTEEVTETVEEETTTSQIDESVETSFAEETSDAPTEEESSVNETNVEENKDEITLTQTILIGVLGAILGIGVITLFIVLARKKHK